jgi:hypothetical protein
VGRNFVWATGEWEHGILGWIHDKPELGAVLLQAVLWILILKDPKRFQDPDPKLDMNLTKNHKKISNLIIMTLKIQYIGLTFSLKNLL